MLDSYEAVFFDAGGTLFHPYPSVGEIYQRIAAAYGCKANANELEIRFRDAWLSRDGMTSLASHASEKVERDWWHELVSEVFSEIGGISDFEEFFTELYDIFAHAGSWRLYEDVTEVLADLKRRGKRLGIVSNWDSRLFGLCKGLGVDGHFDFIIASAVFGASKPNPKIFEEAVKLSGVSPEHAVHVGDSYQDDVVGARRAGIGAVLIDRSDAGRHDRQEVSRDVPLIHDLRQLIAQS
ncbi:MAG: HAD-IA family hydrolase [Candidatus Omnitrophota bacterium]|nr:HAD-IA family hydrolase [Candidatus Omnitrophota bacterium]